MTARFAAGLEAAPTIQLAGWRRASRQEAFQWKLDRHFIVPKQAEVTIDGKGFITIVPGSFRIGAPPPQPVQQSIGFPDVRDANDGYCKNTHRYYKSFKEPCPYCGNYHHV